MEYNNRLAELEKGKMESERQIASYQEEISRLDSQGIPDPGRYNGLKSSLTESQAKLAAINSEIEQLEGVAQEAQEELFNEFENIVVAGFPFSLRALSKGEDEYQTISAFFQQYVGNLAQQHAVMISSYKSQVEQIEEELVELDNLRKQNYELSDKLADMELRRDAAADELQQAQEEAKRLAEDNAKLRSQIESKSQPTNFTADASEIARRLHEAKTAIYNRRWKEGLSRTHYQAELAETGETIEIPYLDLGMYREVSTEEAARFRADKEKAELERLAQEVVEHIEAPSLPIYDAGVSPDPVSGEVVQETVTREEYEALRHEVTMIAVELKSRSILPMNWEAGAA